MVGEQEKLATSLKHQGDCVRNKLLRRHKEVGFAHFKVEMRVLCVKSC